MKTKFEERKEEMNNIVGNYKMGFISAYEMICQIDQIAWNPLERKAIQRAFDDSLKLKLNTFEHAVRCQAEKTQKIKTSQRLKPLRCFFIYCKIAY